MRPFKVLVLGYQTDEFDLNESIMWVVMTERPIDVNHRENYRMVKKMVESVDLILLNLDDRTGNFDDGVIVQMAYSIQTPILAVGHFEDSDLIYNFEDNGFLSLSEAVDHITAYYL